MLLELEKTVFRDDITEHEDDARAYVRFGPVIFPIQQLVLRRESAPQCVDLETSRSGDG